MFMHSSDIHGGLWRKEERKKKHGARCKYEYVYRICMIWKKNAFLFDTHSKNILQKKSRQKRIKNRTFLRNQNEPREAKKKCIPIKIVEHCEAHYRMDTFQLFLIKTLVGVSTSNRGVVGLLFIIELDMNRPC